MRTGSSHGPLLAHALYSQVVRGSGPLNTCSTTTRENRPVASIDVELVVPAVLGICLILVSALMTFHLGRVGNLDTTDTGNRFDRDALLTLAKLESLRQ